MLLRGSWSPKIGSGTDGRDMKPLATIRHSDGLAGLQKALRARWMELGVRAESLDEVGGLPVRYTAKLLAEYPTRSLGPTSLGPLLGVLGVMLVVVEDEEQQAKIAGRLSKRLVPGGNAGRTMLARQTRKRKANASFRVSPEWARLCRAAQLLQQSDRQRSNIAKRAALARWRRLRRVVADAADHQ